MRPEERRHAILGLAGERNGISVDEIARRFGVSRETARRDLARLDADGLLRRIHGGAKTGSEAALSLRMAANAAAKARIARAAAQLFEPGDSLLIDAGSTTAFFASALAEAPGMTLITNSLDVASRAASGATRHRILLLGGDFRAGHSEVAGALAIDQIGRLRADHAVLTVGGVDAQHGIMDFDLEEAMVARAMARQSDRVTVLADASKFGRVALAQVAPLGAVARLVTDAPPPEPLALACRRAGTEVVVAP
jgi:DeoR family glycerol-3-phosphate regulon repressor